MRFRKKTRYEMMNGAEVMEKETVKTHMQSQRKISREKKGKKQKIPPTIQDNWPVNTLDKIKLL